MKSPFVNELEPNQVVTTSFLVRAKEIRQKKSGELYLSLQLGDRTGEVDGKMWDNVAEVMDTFDRDDFVKVKGLVQVYQNRPQLTIHKLRRMDESEVEFADYFPCSERDPNEMWAELRGFVSGIANPHLRGRLDALLDGAQDFLGLGVADGGEGGGRRSLPFGDCRFSLGRSEWGVRSGE
jgi:3'-5' exoribonuclease